MRNSFYYMKINSYGTAYELEGHELEEYISLARNNAESSAR